MKFLTIVATFVTLTLAGCQTAPDRPDYRATVELDIYSGRPNPSWALPDTLVAPLLREIEKLPTVAGQEMFEGLGYRGFSVNFSPKNGDSTFTLRVHRQLVRVQKAGAATFRIDPDRAVEKMLIESARAHVDTAALRVVEPG